MRTSDGDSTTLGFIGLFEKLSSGAFGNPAEPPDLVEGARNTVATTQNAELDGETLR